MNALIHEYLFDPSRILSRRLETLKEALYSTDTREAHDAELEADEILRWLVPERGRESFRDWLVALLNNSVLTDEQLRRAAAKGARATGSQRGRKRQANALERVMAALILRHGTGLRWREIVQRIERCLHVTPRARMSCQACGEAMGKNAGRLERVLKKAGFDPREEFKDFRDPIYEQLLRERVRVLLSHRDSGK